MIKFASSPAHIDDDVKQRNASFKKQTISPSTGPSKKEMSTMSTLPKSSFKNSAPNSGNGISKKLTTYESATNTAMSARRFAVKRSLENNAFGFVIEVGEVFTEIRTNLEPVMEFYANGWTKIAQTIENLATKVIEGVTVVIEFIKPAIEAVRDFVADILDGLPRWITNK